MTTRGKATDYQSSRRELARVVREEGYGDPARLARLVTDAPAFATLTASEWWNVALCLAQYGRFPDTFPRSEAEVSGRVK